MIIVRWITITLIWFTGCAVADFVLEIEQNAWAMAWGVVVWALAMTVVKT